MNILNESFIITWIIIQQYHSVMKDKNFIKKGEKVLLPQNNCFCGAFDNYLKEKVRISRLVLVLE